MTLLHGNYASAARSVVTPLGILRRRTCVPYRHINSFRKFDDTNTAINQFPTLSLPPPEGITNFDTVAGLGWSNAPDSYAGDSLATGRVSHSTQVKCGDPDTEGYLGPPSWGVGHEAATNPIKKHVLLRRFKNWKRSKTSRDCNARTYTKKKKKN